MSERLLGLSVALALLAVHAVHTSAQRPGERFGQPIPGTELSIHLAFVPGGPFEIGSPPHEPGRDPDEGPVRTVRVSGFWMSVHEVTHEQFGPFRYRRLDSEAGPSPSVLFDVDAVTRPSPPYEDPAHGMPKGASPAVGMTRLAALRYARWLSGKTGRLYRLPTEAEWEYACRAGGSEPSAVDADVLEDTAWYEANSSGVYHPVGSKAPNAWGVHDLRGNVAEWVMDDYAEDAYAALPVDEASLDPVDPEPVLGRGVVRGGAFDDPSERLRCAERFPEASAWKRRDPQVPKSRWWNTDSPHVGFRLVSPATVWTSEEIDAYWARVLGTQ